jgi:uncharacterized protein involved in exopolysaccharide biosynthesis
MTISEADAPPRREQLEGRSFVKLAAVLLRGHRTMLRSAVGTLAIVTAVLLLLPQKFTSYALFVPQSSEQLPVGGLAQLAGQFGVMLPAGDVSQSPQFYSELVWSRPILEPLLWERHRILASAWFGAHLDTLDVPLVDLIPVNEPDSAVRVEESLEWIRKHVVGVNTSRQTGVLTLTVRTKWPRISQSVATSIVAALNEFNLESRQTQAGSEARFVEARSVEAESTLRVSEAELRTFLERNRSLANSPALLFERDRLQRDVAMRQQVYTSLVEAMEQARIAEVRNTPLLTIVQPPSLPAQPDDRELVLVALATLIFGLTLGGALVIGRDLLRSSIGSGGGDALELRGAWGEFRQAYRLGRKPQKE